MVTYNVVKDIGHTDIVIAEFRCRGDALDFIENINPDDYPTAIEFWLQESLN